jgi:hypothetical protein
MDSKNPNLVDSRLPLVDSNMTIVLHQVSHLEIENKFVVFANEPCEPVLEDYNHVLIEPIM